MTVGRTGCPECKTAEIKKLIEAKALKTKKENSNA